MTNVKQAFSDKKFPPLITSHNIFQTFKEVRKVFPEIGLPNSETEIEIDNKKEVRVVANNLVNEIKYCIDDRITSLNNYCAEKENKIGPKRKKKLENINKLLGAVKATLTNSKSRDKCLKTQRGKTTLNLTQDITDVENKIVFKAGEGLFRVYNKLNDLLRDGHFLAMDKYEDCDTFKDFSSKNVPALKYKVRFSSDGSEGLWDIATMSMRGISSCQSWDSANSSHLVGSVIDPFTGIIYLTSGTKYNDLGSKMIRRCIVRFMVDERKNVPFIGIEKMYPSMEKAALDSFIDFLKTRTDNKFDVVYLPNSQKTLVYVPISKAIEKLETHYQPYRDSAIAYKKDINGSPDAKTQTRLKLDAVGNSVASKVITVARGMRVTEIPASSKHAFKMLRSTHGSHYLRNEIYRRINDVFGCIKAETYTNSNDFLKAAIETIQADKLEDRLFDVISDMSVNYYGTIDMSVKRQLAKLSAEKISAYLTTELKKIKPTSETKPQPIKHPAIPIYTKLLS